MVDEKRSEKRLDDFACPDVNVMVQHGFEFEKYTPKLIDYTSSGMQFEDEPAPEIIPGATVVIEMWCGKPTEKRVIDARIVWVEDYQGKISYGVKFFEKNPGLKSPH